MNKVQLNSKEQNLIADSTIISKKLTKSFLNKTIKWSPSRYETFKKKEVVEALYGGMMKGYVSLGGEVFYKEKWFSGSYCQCSNMTRCGEYLADYRNRLLIECRFSGNSNEIVEVINVYRFENFKSQIKYYPQKSETLEYEDDPKGHYQLKSPKNGKN